MGKPTPPAWKQRALAAVSEAEEQNRIKRLADEQKQEQYNAKKREAHWSYFVQRLGLANGICPILLEDVKPKHNESYPSIIDGYVVIFDDYEWHITCGSFNENSPGSTKFYLHVKLATGVPGAGAGRYFECGDNDLSLGRAIQQLEEIREQARNTQHTGAST